MLIIVYSNKMTLLAIRQSEIKMHSKKAFSLLELIFVVSIVAILLGIAILGIRVYNNRLELKTAEQIFVQALNNTRSEARKYSLDYEISFQEHSFTVVSSEKTKTYQLGNIKLNKLKGSKKLVYYAPYGKTKATNFEFELVSNSGQSSKVYVYGVTGKVASHE